MTSDISLVPAVQEQRQTANLRLHPHVEGDAAASASKVPILSDQDVRGDALTCILQLNCFVLGSACAAVHSLLCIWLCAYLVCAEGDLARKATNL